MIMCRNVMKEQVIQMKNDIATKAWSNVVTSATDDEKKLIAENLPITVMQDELQRRTDESVSILMGVYDALGEMKDDMTLLEMKAVIDNLKNVLFPKPKMPIKKPSEVLEEAVNNAIGEQKEEEVDDNDRE